MACKGGVCSMRKPDSKPAPKSPPTGAKKTVAQRRAEAKASWRYQHGEDGGYKNTQKTTEKNSTEAPKSKHQSMEEFAKEKRETKGGGLAGAMNRYKKPSKLTMVHNVGTTNIPAKEAPAKKPVRPKPGQGPIVPEPKKRVHFYENMPKRHDKPKAILKNSISTPAKKVAPPRPPRPRMPFKPDVPSRMLKPASARPVPPPKPTAKPMRPLPAIPNKSMSPAKPTRPAPVAPMIHKPIIGGMNPIKNMPEGVSAFKSPGLKTTFENLPAKPNKPFGGRRVLP